MLGTLADSALVLCCYSEDAVQQRNFTLFPNSGSDACNDEPWSIDRLGWDDITAFPVRNR